MGRRLALVIATYEYEDAGLRRLTAPAHDAEALAEVLADPSIAGFEVTTLVNEPLHRVGRAIGEFYRDRRRDDLTLLYFTGHGLKDDQGRLYLAMTNTRRDNLLFTALSADHVDQALESCPSRRKVLVLDCCYSGAFPAGRIPKADPTVHTLERFQGRGRTVLTASDSTQYSFEGDRPHGRAVQSVFTRHLVEGLRDGAADLDGDGDITVDELYSYVHDRVVEEMPQQRPKKQDDVQGRTVIARNVNWTLPTYLANALASPVATDRLGALDGLARLWRIGNDVVRTRAEHEIRRLADDDSRLVSAAASALLATPPGTPVRPEPAPPPPSKEPASDRPTPPLARATAPPLSDTAATPPPRRRTTAAPPPRIAPEPPAPTTSHTAEPAVPSRKSAILRHLRTRRTQVLAAALVVVLSAAVTMWLSRDQTRSGGSSSEGARAAQVIKGTVQRVELSPDGKILAGFTTGAAGEQVLLWTTEDGKEVTTLDGAALAFAADPVVALGKGDGTAQLWSRTTHRTTATLGDHGTGPVMAVTPDGTVLATAATCACTAPFDTPVRLWNTADGNQVGTLTGHTNGIQSMRFSHDGKTLVTGSVDRTARVWDVAAAKNTVTIDAGYIVALSPDGTTLATSSQFTDKIRLWDTAGGAETRVLDGAGEPVSFSLDGKTLVTTGFDREVVQLWEVGTGELVRAETPDGPWAVSPDHRTLAVGAADGSVRLLYATTGGARTALTGHTGRVAALAFSPDGRTLVTAGTDDTIRVWPVG